MIRQQQLTRLNTLHQHFTSTSARMFFGSQEQRFRVEENAENQYITLHPLKEEDHKYSLVWLHGLGDSAYGFADVFIDPNYNVVPPSCKVVLPTAPKRAVSLNMGMLMTSWYDIKTLDRPVTMTREQAEANYN